MKNIVRTVAAWTLACVATIAFVSSLAVLSGVVFTHQKAAAVIQQTILAGDLRWATARNEDFFTECAMLQFQVERPADPFLQAIDTKFRQGNLHPCEILRQTFFHSPEQFATFPPVTSYFHYPYGARFLEAFALSAMSFGHARVLYYALSYGSLALLLAAMFWRDRLIALILTPIPVVLGLSFSLHKFGGNLAHAPGFFICWLMLAVFVAAKPWFVIPGRRAGFIASISIMTIWFDLLSGVIPTMLALTIVLNHFFYVRESSDEPGYLGRVALNAAAITASFLAAFFIINLPRLALLSAIGVDTSHYLQALLFRASDNTGSIRVTFLMNMVDLFNVRYQMSPGGEPIASWTILTGIVSWVVALVLLAARYNFRTGIDVIVFAGALAVVFAWYLVFAQHTNIHILFMVRLFALPAAFGMAALATVWMDLRQRAYPAWASNA